MTKSFSLCSLLYFVHVCAWTDPPEVAPGLARKLSVRNPFLKVIASTFNAANKAYKDNAEFSDLADVLIAGHEGADLAILGFQEFGDDSTKFGKVIQTQKLWQETHPAKPQLIAQKYSSGGRCELGGHLDTLMYVYSNPKSPWTFFAPRYFSARCQMRKSSSQENPGCNIDNSGTFECGKVVNLLKIEARRQIDGYTINLCAMNTHLSFAEQAAQRNKNLEEAMDESVAAGCDAVVFVGDFNSRLHCLDSEDSTGDVPAYEFSDPSSSSFHTILRNVCSGPACETRGSTKVYEWDELTSMLTAGGNFQCFEKPEDGGKKWDLVETPSRLSSFNLREVALPPFPPTYKVSAPHPAYKKPDVWIDCSLAGEGLCFVNSDGKGKHNPAWTDRILVSVSKAGLKWQPLEYSRRPASPTFGTDHTAVVARIAFKPGSTKSGRTEEYVVL